MRPCRCLKWLLLLTWREYLLRPLIIYNSFLFLMKNVLRHDDHNKGLALIYMACSCNHVLYILGWKWKLPSPMLDMIQFLSPPNTTFAKEGEILLLDYWTGMDVSAADSLWYGLYEKSAMLMFHYSSWKKNELHSLNESDSTTLGNSWGSQGFSEVNIGGSREEKAKLSY